jgi:hypothetical protein
MAKQVPWNKLILDEFVHLAALNEEEEKIIRTRAAGWTRVKQSIEFDMSLSSIDRIIRRLKVKYDHAQKHSDILPPRRFSANETYKDENMNRKRNV